MLQTSTIELFRSYAIAIAPAGGFADLDRLDSDAEGAGLCFSGGGMSGELVLAAPRAILAAMGHGEALGARDWVRELANQLLGRVKNRLLRYEVRLGGGVPSALQRLELRARLASDVARVYMFRSLRGVVFVALHGTTVLGDLRLKGSESGPGEGDLVLF
jgi:hypothetical protein